MAGPNSLAEITYNSTGFDRVGWLISGMGGAVALGELKLKQLKKKDRMFLFGFVKLKHIQRYETGNESVIMLLCRTLIAKRHEWHFCGDTKNVCWGVSQKNWI